MVRALVRKKFATGERKRDTTQFKIVAIELVTEQGMSRAQWLSWFRHRLVLIGQVDGISENIPIAAEHR